ncbi:SPOR domain-containing protein [Marinilongibacter aquaticus]|uniref:HU domain-containing protein n=1 Tax=Marinilongibacter aquaticus TaxID=2975157 RepID=UPI0021BDD3CD|nr:SPOR domain-containing protein [Marinilongibacter aquaticus]UBM59464.1 SPOR domain-containing protein [Marinilongibacter aquaticus]
MINIERYIKEALYAFDFFIVPGLGAFIANYTAPELNAVGEIESPKKTFEFNGLLRKGTDNRFVEFIAQNEKHSKTEILEALDAFLKEKRQSLETNSKEVISDVMSLRLDEQGLFVGQLNAKINFYEKGAEWTEIVEEEVFEEEIQPAEDPIEEEIETPIVDDEPEAVEETEETLEEESFTDNSMAVPLSLLENEETVSELDSSESEEEIGDEEAVVSEAIEEETEEEELEYEYSKKRPWLNILWAIIAMALIFLGFYYYSKMRHQKTDTGTVQAKAVRMPIDSLEQVVVGEVDSLNQENPEYKYEVSAGYFKSASNAESLMNKMKEAGFNAEIKELNNRYRVFVGVQTEEAAERMSKLIEQFTGLESVYFDEHGNSSNR